MPLKLQQELFTIEIKAPSQHTHMERSITRATEITVSPADDERLEQRYEHEREGRRVPVEQMEDVNTALKQHKAAANACTQDECATACGDGER